MAKNSAKRNTSYAYQKSHQNNNPTSNSNIAKPPVPPGMGLVSNQLEATSYIADMLAVLCNMAKDVDLKFLNYLLEMAYEESLTHCKKASTTAKSHPR